MIKICAYCGAEIAEGYMNQHLSRCKEYHELMRKLEWKNRWKPKT